MVLLYRAACLQKCGSSKNFVTLKYVMEMGGGNYFSGSSNQILRKSTKVVTISLESPPPSRLWTDYLLQTKSKHQGIHSSKEHPR